MEKHRAETLLFQILSGYTAIKVSGKELRVYSPSIDQRREAAEVYQQAYESTAYDMWMTDAQIKSLLISIGHVSPEIDENFKEIDNRIEDLKVDIYSNIFNTEKREKTRSILNKVKQKQAEMIMKRHQFDGMTREGYANIIKTQFLVACTTVDAEGNRVFPNPHNANFPLLDKVVSQVTSSSYDEKDLRCIARMDMWRGYWQVAKVTGTLFDKPIVLLTDDQKLLCQMSKMYDGAYEHPECPSDDIIDDDDAFDGWMIKERRKNEKDRDQKMVDDITKGRHGNADEVYVMANSKKDAKKINNLNDVEGQVVKKQRQATLKQHGTVPDVMMPDQQRRLQIEAAQKMSETVKAKKGK